MASNLDTIKGLYESFAVGDLPAVLALMDDKIEWNEPAGLAPVFTDQIGPQAVAENVFGQVLSLTKDFAVVPEEFVDGGDVIVTLGWYRGKGAETGKPLDSRMAHVFHFRDGKIVSFRTILDTHVWREALGL